MDFSFSDDQEGIRQLLKQVLGDIVTDDSLKALEKAGEWFHERAWKQLAESGMLGLALPESVGGAGLGLTELCLLLQQAGRTVAPIPALSTLVSAALPIAEFGSEAQKQRWLPGVARGEVILSAALCEVGSRDPLQPVARATRGDGGWRISGTFTNVPYLAQAQRVLVAAAVDGGIGVFLLDPAAAGVRIEEQRGTDNQPLGLLRLESAAVLNEDVIGEPGSAAHILRFAVERTVLGQCALQLGICEQALFLTANYSAERKQFGVPIATFQGVTQRVADAYIDVAAMRVSLWQACWRLVAGKPAEQSLAVAKFWAADGGARVTAAAQHVHGGTGFDRDYPLHRYFLAAKRVEFTLGNASEQLAMLGDLLVV